MLDVAAEVPDGAEHVDVDSGLFRPSPDDMRVELELAQAGRWVAEYYPCEEVTELGDGRLNVVLRTPDTRWVRRLALRLGEDGKVTRRPSWSERSRRRPPRRWPSTPERCQGRPHEAGPGQ